MYIYIVYREICIYIYRERDVHIYIYIYIYMHIYIYIHTYTCIYIYIYIYTCVYRIICIRLLIMFIVYLQARTSKVATFCPPRPVPRSGGFPPPRPANAAKNSPPSISGGVRPISLLRLSPLRCRLKTSGEFPMDMRIAPLEIKIMIESNPLKSRILVRILARMWRAYGTWSRCSGRARKVSF